VQRVQAARSERYASLRGYFHGMDDIADDDEHLQVRLHSVPLQDNAASIGERLDQLNLAILGAEITAVRRGKTRIPFSPDTMLEMGDVVVLRGNAEAIDLAEKRLLQKQTKNKPNLN
jgi:CPA2 family monovalent cation:H+ antiporter-2